MKIFEAIVEDGIIKADKGKVVECPILGEGGNSQGFLIIAEGKIVYLPKTSPDLKATLSYLSELISTLAAEIHQSNMGGEITASTFTTDLATIKNKIEALKGALR